MTYMIHSRYEFYIRSYMCKVTGSSSTHLMLKMGLSVFTMLARLNKHYLQKTIYAICSVLLVYIFLDDYAPLKTKRIREN